MNRLRRRAARLQSDFVVGVFIVLVLVMIGWMLWKLGAWQKPDGYALHALFDNAMGLKSETSVYMSGIKIGEVTGIALDPQSRRAKVSLFIEESYAIPQDSTARIRSEGVLGANVLEIVPGQWDSPALPPDAVISRTEKPADLEEILAQLGSVAGDIKKVSSSLASALGSPEGETSLHNIVQNIENLTARLDGLVERNRDGFDRFVDSMADSADRLRADLPRITENLRDLTADLRRLIENNEEGVGLAVQRVAEASSDLQRVLSELAEVTEKINAGEGTIGKLVNDEQTVTSINKALDGVNDVLGRAQSFKTYLSYRGEYLTRSGEFKNYLGLTIRPNPNKFYQIELIDDPIGRREEILTTTTSNDTADNEFHPGENTHTERTLRYRRDKFLFSLQLGYRFWDLTVRAGVLQSHGGLGLDYRLWDERAKLTVEAFDFSRPDNNPVLRAYATFLFFDHVFLSAGGNDLLYDPAEDEETLAEFFVGAGLTFEDEDIKFLLTSSGLPTDF